MSTGRHGDVRMSVLFIGTEVVLPDRCMTTHLLSFSFAAYEAFEDSGVNEKSRFDIAGFRVRPVYP
jgi:hypothetical protein